ncbi:hypothetical protein ACP3T3_00635 [Chryseobacterium sp. CBSDS_008]|uniref:hypothetical protein n=1 Tax=Chryseobacterium sp. CBSDS_008 TaxID=3415265 RepID=UPI003CF0C67E
MKEKTIKNLLVIAFIAFCVNVSIAQTITPTVPQPKTKSEAASTVKLKKDGTPDKRYSTANEKTTVRPTQNQTVTRPSIPNSTNTTSYTPTVDRTLKGPNGEEILTGPRGGKYYINKNGNKTYIKKN